MVYAIVVSVVVGDGRMEALYSYIGCSAALAHMRGAPVVPFGWCRATSEAPGVLGDTDFRSCAHF